MSIAGSRLILQSTHEFNNTWWTLFIIFALAELLFDCFTYHLARNILYSFQQSEKKKHKIKQQQQQKKRRSLVLFQGVLGF